MYPTNGSGPQINGGPGMAPAQPQNVYGGGPSSHAQTLSDLLAQYNAHKQQPQVNPGPNPGMPQAPTQPGQRGYFLQRRREMHDGGQHPMMSRLFGMYFQ